ncbi:MAG TPA: biopolymer transporter ExbD [Hyphomonas sp.]|nr:protein TolR [Hyphomonas sp.]HRJ00221.1 biopolymer transporter ExbD [Hyphomonas sp.]HRK67785.1 biopolymer transporter ExbD [Hyphomonas sp.]
MGLILGSGGKGGRRGRRALNAEINVTPFVDVMLVLLIVFMVTAPLLIRGEQVNLPKTTSAPLRAEANDAPLTLWIREDGKVYVQQTEIDPGNLAAQLTAIVGEGYDKQVYLYADQDVPYGRVMEVTAEVRRAGYTRMSFITEQKR